jgi:hypothetical protein
MPFKVSSHPTGKARGPPQYKLIPCHHHAGIAATGLATPLPFRIGPFQLSHGDRMCRPETVFYLGGVWWGESASGQLQ